MQKYIEALNALNWDMIFEAAKKEASREVTEMNKWLKTAKDYNTDEWKDFNALESPIKKAAKYQFRIYNRNREVKALTKLIAHLEEQGLNPDLTEEELAEAQTKHAELSIQKTDLEFEQFTLAGRVLKIYTIVSGYVVLSPGKGDTDEEDLYDSEDEHE
jgi:hypothetical protein